LAYIYAIAFTAGGGGRPGERSRPDAPRC